MGVAGDSEALTGGLSGEPGAVGLTEAKSSRVRQGGMEDGTVLAGTRRVVLIGVREFYRVRERGQGLQAEIGGSQRGVAEGRPVGPGGRER